MNRRKLYNFLRLPHLLIDRSLSRLFGLKFRQKYIQFIYKIKIRLFPEFAATGVGSISVTSMPQSTTWMQPSIPEWVLEEMRELAHHIDPILDPNSTFLSSCHYYSVPVIPKPGQIYAQLMRQCTSKSYSHVFAIPWLKRGGADLVTLRHIEFANNLPNAKVLVLMTESGDSPWLIKVASNVDVLNLSQYVSQISHDEMLQVIVRLIVQLNIGVLHIINSRHTWDVVSKFGLAITQHTKIFASVYCDDYDLSGLPVGYARQYLGSCYKHMSKVFSDNQTFPQLLHQTYGYPKDLFCVLKSPALILDQSQNLRSPKGKRVLWAGRLDRQKRPDLLLGVARLMPDIEFHVYGDALLESKNSVINDLKKTKNIRLLGKFDGVESLPFNEFPVFLYTSQWDGIPTIIIAAAIAAIPIVASNVGGVGEVVDEETGFPVRETENLMEYVNAIRYIVDHSAEAEIKAQLAFKQVASEHHQSAFSKKLMSIDDYVNVPKDGIYANVGGVICVA